MVNYSFLLVSVLLLLLSAGVAIAPPPTPHSIAGILYQNGGSEQVPIGTRFSINETVSNDFFRSNTHVPVPGSTGVYSEKVEGVDGDLTIVLAWNATSYGQANRSLQGNLDNVNVYLNYTRPAETNVTILTPANGAIFGVNTLLNATINVTVHGGADGQACNATIRLSNDTVIAVQNGELYNHTLGDIPRGGFNFTVFNLSANAAGVTNLTVTTTCLGMDVNLEGSDAAEVVNLLVTEDVTAPVVQLMSPPNNTHSTQSTVQFTYNVSEESPLQSCSLIINNVVNTTNETVVLKDTPQTFTQTFNDGTYNWTARCTDVYFNSGEAGYFNLTVNATGPLITNVVISDPVTLQTGGQTRVWCNATITPQGVRNVTRVNATFFDYSASFALDSDDNNYHYTNASCSNVTLSGTDNNYSCSFDVWYYANNATWTCALTAQDTSNLTSSDEINTSIDALVAFNLTSVIDYGELQASNVSDEQTLTLFNLGNVPINITVEGFGGVRHDNFSMTCGADGNISVDEERYSATNHAYAQMVPLTNDSVLVANFTLFQRTQDNGHTTDSNMTFWRMRVPFGSFSACSGSIIVSALAAE